MKKQVFSISNRLKSFKHAGNGLRIFIREEHNARIHFLIAFVVIIMAFYFRIDVIEWVAILFAIGFVLTTEIINTALENICDLISKERNERIKTIKDLSAAAVLISAITALVIGIIVFLPKLFTLK
ncbi:MAG: diacylglycerol kinase family protein [Bacteroidota bacterium]|nr:diacylglycerol kinase family protein [Bacteroidota bacterium]